MRPPRPSTRARRLTLLGTLVAVLVPAAPAAASLAQIEPNGVGNGATLEVNADGAAGHDLTIDFAAGAYVLTDTAPLDAGPWCTQIGESEVSCAADTGRGRVDALTVTLGATNDKLTLGAIPAADLVNGTVLKGGAGNDTITGAATDDLIDGGSGNDTLNGMAGDDTFVANSVTPDPQDPTAAVADGTDVINGGPGTHDLVAYGQRRTVQDVVARTEPVTIVLNAAATTTGNGAAGENDSLSGVEDAIGGNGGDTITGGSADNTLAGGAGTDTVSGLGGDDDLRGGPGTDILRGGQGTDLIDAREVFGDLGGAPDTEIDCGTGPGDPGTEADRVATDAPDLTVNCETVAPLILSTPEVVGTPEVGQDLEITNIQALGLPGPTFSGSWSVCATPGGVGCTLRPAGMTYTPGPEDVGRYVVVQAVASNADPEGVRFAQDFAPSVAVGPITAAPEPRLVPSIVTATKPKTPAATNTVVLSLQQLADDVLGRAAMQVKPFRLTHVRGYVPKQAQRTVTIGSDPVKVMAVVCTKDPCNVVVGGKLHLTRRDGVRVRISLGAQRLKLTTREARAITLKLNARERKKVRTAKLAWLQLVVTEKQTGKKSRQASRMFRVRVKTETV